MLLMAFWEERKNTKYKRSRKKKNKGKRDDGVTNKLVIGLVGKVSK